MTVASNRYPFGKLFLCCGMAMSVSTAYGVFCAESVQRRFGDVTMLSLGFLGVGLLLLLTIDVYRKANPKVAITLGIVGWLATFGMLFYFYQHLL